MWVCVVSHCLPNELQSYCCLLLIQVAVGSYSDPDDIPGLAHFLEHMLFFASEKYPEENGYGKFVQVGYLV